MAKPKKTPPASTRTRSNQARSTSRTQPTPVDILVLGDIQIDDVFVPLPFAEEDSGGPSPGGHRTAARANGDAGGAAAPHDAGERSIVLYPYLKQNWQRNRQYRRYRRPGGAWLLGNVVRKAVPDAAVEILGAAEGERFCTELEPQCLLSIAALQEFPESDSEKPPKKKKLVYRMPQRGLLGWIRTGSTAEEAAYSEAALRQLLDAPQLDRERLGARLVVLHDHNLGFRDIDGSRSIEPFLNSKYFGEGAGAPRDSNGIILLHMDGPLATGHLWDFLTGEKRLGSRMVVVVDAGDLRDYGVTLVEDISFEQTVSDFVGNLDRHGPLAKLARCMCVIVKSPQGAIVCFSGASGKPSQVNISFLPYAGSGPISDPEKYGYMRGYSVILLAALARGIHWAQMQRDTIPFHARVAEGIKWGTHLGIALCERHLRDGFIRWDESGVLPPDNQLDPYGDLFAHVLPPDPAAPAGRPRRDWEKELSLATMDFDLPTLAILERWTRVDALAANSAFLSVEAAAQRVVTHGLQELVDSLAQEGPCTLPEPQTHMPARLPFSYARFGDLTLVDRDEIDSISSVASLVSKYLSDESWDRPLSIAVFGPPGSGKSFSVKQIMKYAGGDTARPLEFNVSQFQCIGDLAKAFHVVQDKALAEEDAPLVFFDEFDTTFGAEPLGWLRYFLAPMQDGSFRDGETTFKVGRAILVFAGGIYDTFQQFYGDQKETDGFRASKGPDFVSRLRGHLNIPGINPVAEVDGLLMFRRAILLRAILEKSGAEVIDPNTKWANVDPGVIRAFLRAEKYEHGVRSMEAIVQMASISPTRRRFQRSAIPSAAQLAMHVDAREFLDHLREE